MKNIKKLLPVALLILAALIYVFLPDTGEDRTSALQDTAAPSVLTTAAPTAAQTEAPRTEASRTQAPPESQSPAATAPEAEAPLPEDESYTSVEDVSYYLHTYGHLPDNYITKAEAQAAGWEPGEGNLWEVTDGKSIGGDRFGNYEGLLPEGETYKECDVNYDGGYRGEERIIYGSDGSIWYTDDHYESFERLY